MSGIATTPSKRLYLMGIGGIAMGTLAGMLQDMGYHVTGSDTQLYPPMSTFLERKQIPVLPGYAAENIRAARPEMVIVGNVIRKDNPEAQEAAALEIPMISMPQALERFVLYRHRSLVVCGTHGKTTTTGLLGFVLETAELDPSVFIGGFVKNWDRSYRIGSGPYMALEGDEYDTAFFDKGPKFLHYQPWAVILTSIEFDHADIYRDIGHIEEAFRRLCRLIPQDGLLVTCGDDSRCLDAAKECRAEVVTYGRGPDCHWRLDRVEPLEGRVCLTVRDPFGGSTSWESPLLGRHNALNTLGVLALCRELGIPDEAVQEALRRFEGMRRRQDILYQDGSITIIDDFAHHPTAVRETVRAIKECYPHSRLLAVFEPRTNTSRRRFFQETYPEAFTEADWVGIKEPAGFHAIPSEERLDTRALVHEIARRGIPAQLYREDDPVVLDLMVRIRPGDTLLLMSNGSMDDVPRRLAQACQDAFGSQGRRPALHGG
ncbi:UDP-N-acetylmuramate--L-alanine ligase [Desulfacinum hydrothermale DSM 13146]|uniref:UDP-N-acetylmuramate--L-alanine ligase n=1 Tax=Desulfacinum hydrothermale DSM 13146 TaxID=1121390 RepID=A0A1W1X242_9BACT|nr:Mur ligase domain-containing protein [Desulfacinum hydrothermale]SMC17974.1 UDP-N-acetylmuramate--L-alanine ligase [Desulfacinum hydrothermale DSM 13146]